jgi:hypothetical protein
MARAKTTKQPVAGPGTINKVHRPHLSDAEQQLAAQYRPAPCRCTTDDHFGWLMEKPTEGQALEYYCSNCGKFSIVPRS